MKKAFAIVICMALCLCACFGTAEGLLGGWQVPEDNALTDEALSALDSALEGFVGSKIEPVALLATQVVSGVNYCILCRVTPVVPNAVTHMALVYVYQPLQGNASLLTIEDLSLGVWG